MKHLVIITKMPFPEGFAATIRFTTYSRGVIQGGMPVTVHCIKPTEFKNKVVNEKIEGFHQGINFIYTSGTTVKQASIFLRFFQNIFGLVCSLHQVLMMRMRKENPVVLFIGPIGFCNEFCYFLLSRMLNFPILQERSELPYIVSRRTVFSPLRLWFYLHITCKLYDGMIVITESLEEYFKHYLRKKSLIYILPIVVDPERFAFRGTKSDHDYLAYCGSMEGNKDGLEDLISAFAMVVQTYPDLHLKLVGRTDFDGFDRLKSKVESLGLLSQIRFVGRVSNEEMVRILTGAKILVLARPMTEQAKGNFPTKLGEYLATGNPVLATRVGEVTKYLIDGQNAFLAEPSDPIDFAKKIHAIFQEYEHALKIGEKGRLLAQSVFNYKIQGRNLIGFFNTVI